MQKKLHLLSFLFFSLCIAFYWYTHTVQPSSPSLNTLSVTPVLGEQTKSADCISLNGMPDSSCTPGAISSSATKEQVCTPGYSASVRNVTAETKKLVYSEYGITHHSRGEYEVDHLISLELGGSNDIANLWPEAASPTPGFHEKDLVENYLHDMVCKGSMSLEQAQMLIAHDWESVYKSVPNIQDYNWNKRHE